MSLFALLVGVILGGLAVVFAMENTASITVTFLAWQATEPLALVLITAVVGGIILALLMMLPRAIREALDAYALRRERLAKDEELARYRAQTADVPASTAGR